MVEFVLEYAGEPPGRLDLERLLLEIDAAQDGGLTAPQRKPFAGNREAPLGLAVFIRFSDRRGSDEQGRVDDGAGECLVVFVSPAVDEEPERHAHLRGGEP